MLGNKVRERAKNNVPGGRDEISPIHIYTARFCMYLLSMFLFCSQAENSIIWIRNIEGRTHGH